MLSAGRAVAACGLRGRELTRRGQAQPGCQHGAAGVGGLEHDGVAGLGEHVTDEEVRAFERQRDDHGAVNELRGDVAVLARLPSPLR